MLTFLGPILTPVVMQIIHWAIAAALEAGAGLDWDAIKADVNVRLRAAIPQKLLEKVTEFVVDAFLDFVAGRIEGGMSPGMALKSASEDHTAFAQHVVTQALAAKPQAVV